MPLPNIDPGVGPSWTLCVGDSWRPPIIGLLEEMCDTGFWEQYYDHWGVLPNYPVIESYKSGAAKILGRIGVNALDEGCTDLEPSTVPPTYGTLYSKHYTFVGSLVPTGWTVVRGTPEGSGLRTADFHAGPGWLRSIGCTLALLHPCHAVSYLHTSYMNLSPLADTPLFLGGFFLSGNSRMSAQCEPLPEAGTWNMAINNALQAATANQVQVSIQIDSHRTGQPDLLGDAWLQGVDVSAYSSAGNPFP